MSKARGPVKFTNVTVSNGAEHGLWGRILDEVIIGRGESCVYDDETQEILPAILVLRKRKPVPEATVSVELPRDVVERLSHGFTDADVGALMQAASRALEQPAGFPFPRTTRQDSDVERFRVDENGDMVNLAEQPAAASDTRELHPLDRCANCNTTRTRHPHGESAGFLNHPFVDPADAPAAEQPACTCADCEYRYGNGTLMEHCRYYRREHDSPGIQHEWRGTPSPACAAHSGKGG